jgi:acyl carrier protein
LAGGNRKEADAEVVAKFLRLVQDLVWELHPHMRRTVAIELDSNLDRELGLDSLGRAELVLRIDRAFKVRLPDRLLGEANTPQDLLMALVAASPERGPLLGAPAAEPAALPEVMAPHAAETLIEALNYHVTKHGSRLHILLWQG